MAYVLMLITCLLMGVLAQTVKERPGAKWAAITATVLLPTWFSCYLAVAMTPASFFNRVATSYALAVLVCGAVGVLMAIVVITLPKQISVRGTWYDIAPLVHEPCDFLGGLHVAQDPRFHRRGHAKRLTNPRGRCTS